MADGGGWLVMSRFVQYGYDDTLQCQNGNETEGGGHRWEEKTRALCTKAKMGTTILLSAIKLAVAKRKNKSILYI